MSLKHALLIMLEAEPGSGYDLVKRFKGQIGYFWNATHQQVYHSLKKLSEAGWVEFEVHGQSDKPDRKVYKITPAGHDALVEWLEAPVKPNKVNDALLVKLYGGFHVDTACLQDELARHVAIHQRTLQKLLAIESQFQSLPMDKQNKYRLPYLTLRRGILGEQAWLAWAAEVAQSLHQPTVNLPE